MASHLSAHQYPNPGSSLPTLSSFPKYSLAPKTCQFQTSKPRNRNPNHKPVTSQARRNDEQSPLRRDVLIGLGGLYTAASNDPFALAAPILGPDLDHCKCDIQLFTGKLDERCCLIRKPNQEIVDFKFEDYRREMAYRKAAHKAGGDFYKLFEEAIEKMKGLPEDDPRSFLNQAKIHCAYCNSAYVQPNGSEVTFQVHNSALFFPFHRWYLYFFERICGHLVGKPDEFRLPFWNWDSPEGMEMPKFYIKDKNSPLYDVFRNPDHVPTGAGNDKRYINLDDPREKNGRKSADAQKKENIATVHNAMVRNSKSARDFLGPIYRAQETPPAGGSGGQMESGPHTAVHIWTGNSNFRNSPDMGSFHTAGRDPLFYAHHANVDRMWNIWKSGEIRGSGNRKDYSDATDARDEKDENDPCKKDDSADDWLDTTFLFYDENQKMVRVKVRDSLDSGKLGYGYEKVDIPWLKCPITPKEQPINVPPTNITTLSSPFTRFFSTAKYQSSPANSRTISSPVKLSEVVEFTVDRPKKKKRTPEEKAKEDEVLVVQNIFSGEEEYVKFDVFINDDDYETTTQLDSQFAGSFGTMEPRMSGGKGGNRRGADLSLALTEILEELNAEEDEFVKVTLVPRSGCRDVTFGGIKIAYNDIS